MKTKFVYLILSAMVLLLGFSNCSSKEEIEGEDSTETKSVFLKINKEAPITYSEESPVGSSSTVGFNSGDLYFVNAAGAILKHYTLSSSLTSGTNISLTDIQAGKIISNLPGQVAAVHVVGNTSGLPTSGNISTVKATALQITSQSDIAEVNLYGSAIPTPTSGNSYNCAITLKPTVARIELTDMTSTGEITGFRVDGIFIDNYYSEATADGSVDSGDLKSNGSVPATFTDNSVAYPTALKTIAYDYYTSGITASSQVAAPATSGDVWAYNLFANTTVGAFAVPRIIIRLSNITTNDGSTYASPQFITIKGLKDSGVSLTAIEAGKVYNIGAGAFSFKETDLTPAPNMNAIDVTVTVTLATWTIVDVTPEL